MLKDNIDFAKIIRRFWRAWPYFGLFGLFFLLVAVWLNNEFPHLFEAKTSVLISKPQRFDDPNRIILGTQTYEKDGDYFFINQQINLKTHPLVLKTLEKLDFGVTYLKKGVLLDRDVYKSAPFHVVLDSSKMSFKREETPFNLPFEVHFIDYAHFSLLADGKYPYPMDDREFYLESTYAFDEWIDTLGLRFKLVLRDSAEFTKKTYGLEDVLETDYAFILNDLEELALSYTENIEVLPEELDASIMKISMMGGHREKVLDFLNTLNNTFIELHLEKKTRVLRSSLESVKKELQKLGEEISTKEEEIKSFKMYYGVSELNRKSEILLERIMSLENDKIDLDAKSEYYAYLHKALASNKGFDQLTSPKAYGIEDPVLIRLTEDLMAQIVERNAFETQGNKDHPSYKQLLSTIEQSKSSILQTIAGFEKTNEVTLRTLEGRLSDLEVSLQQLPEAEKQLVRLERAYLTNSELFNDFNKKRSELEVSIASISPDFSVNEPPYITSAEPIFPNPILVYPLAFILAIFVPSCILVFGRLLNHRILEPEDVVDAVGTLNYVGEIDRSTITHYELLAKYPGSLVQANLDSCFNNIQSRVQRPLSRLLVTSEQSGEGKTMLSSLLASRLACVGKKTVLVNLNIFDKRPPKKNPFASKQLISNQVGYNLYALQDHLFYVEPTLEDRSKEQAVEHVFNVLKHEKYDYLVFLMPSYSHFPNITRLMSEVDAVWWICRRNVTELADLDRSCQELKQNGISNLFYSLNDTYQKLNLFGFFDRRYNNKRRGPISWIKDLFKRA